MNEQMKSVITGLGESMSNLKWKETLLSVGFEQNFISSLEQKDNNGKREKEEIR